MDNMSITELFNTVKSRKGILLIKIYLSVFLNVNRYLYIIS